MEETNAVQESASYAWFKQVQKDCSQLQEFKLLSETTRRWRRHLLRHSLWITLKVTCRHRRRLE